MLGLFAMILPATSTSESCQEGRCTTLPEQPTGEAKGLSLMQSGRSVMPTMDTKLMNLDYQDHMADEFANMEDEFDDGAVMPHTASDFQQSSSKESAFETQVPVLRHMDNPCLYLETLAVIAVFAFAAKGFKWVSAQKPKARESCRAAPAPPASKADTAKPAPVGVQGGIKNFAALEQAVRQGDEATCLELLRQGGRSAVRQEDPCGCTVLHVAAHCGSAKMARLLLNHGAKVDACEAWDETPLHIAARSGSGEVCEILLDHGASIDAVNAHGMTALLLAGHAKQEAVCELLLSRGAGAGGIPDTELPPLVNALLFRRMFNGAVPRSTSEAELTDSAGEDEIFED
jgi:hypothetical protein